MTGPGEGIRGRGRGAPRAGFTLVQLLLVLVSLSIVAALARPWVQRRMLNERAEAVLADVDAVREAVLDYREREDAWPPEARRGMIPDGLESDLPEGFAFAKPEYVLDFQRWADDPRAPFPVGLAVAIRDRALGRAVLDGLSGLAWTDGRSRYTLAIPD